jgi:hypothetical protein
VELPFHFCILLGILLAPRITITISISISILIFGLTKYYSRSHIDANDSEDANSTIRDNQDNDIHNKDQKKKHGGLSNLFVAQLP